MDDMELLLNKADFIIKPVIKKYYGIDGYDYDDLLQIGRIKIWDIICAKKITTDNFDSFKGYLSTAINNLFGTELRKSKAQKRINLRETVSLDAPIGDNSDDEREGYNFIPAKEGIITSETLEFIKSEAMRTRDQNAIKGVVWCLLEIMDLRIKDAPKKINYNTFIGNGLARYLWVFFNNSPFLALRFAYPELKASDMKKRPNGYWKVKNRRSRAIRELKELLERSGYEEFEYPLVVNHNFISKLGLATPLDTIFNGSPFAYLDAVYPKKYKPWMMSVTPINYFEKKKNVFLATRWLIEEVLGFDIPNLSDKDIWRLGIGRKIRKEDFESNGLRGLLARFDNSPEKIIRLAYPKKFQEWDLGSGKKWSREDALKLAGKATRWVIEYYAELTPESPKIGYRFFVENGLRGMITSKKLGFNSSPKAVLRNAYPKKRL